MKKLLGVIALIVAIETAYAGELNDIVATHLEIYQTRGYTIANGDVIVVSDLDVVEIGTFANYVQGLCYQLLNNDLDDQVRSITMVNKYGDQGYKFTGMFACKEISDLVFLMGTKTPKKVYRRLEALVASHSHSCRVGHC